MDTILSPEPAVRVTQATEFVVVSFWQPKTGSGDGDYEYETCATQNDALDLYRQYEDGEWSRARAIGIFPARNGMPLGSRYEPSYIARLMKDTRAR